MSEIKSFTTKTIEIVTIEIEVDHEDSDTDETIIAKANEVATSPAQDRALSKIMGDGKAKVTAQVGHVIVNGKVTVTIQFTNEVERANLV